MDLVVKKHCFFFAIGYGEQSHGGDLMKPFKGGLL